MEVQQGVEGGISFHSNVSAVDNKVASTVQAWPDGSRRIVEGERDRRQIGHVPTDPNVSGALRDLMAHAPAAPNHLGVFT